MASFRVGRSGATRRLLLVGCLMLILPALLLIWTSPAPALTVPTLDSQARPTFSSGFDHCLAIAADGSLWSWGVNDRGQLGIGATPEERNTPGSVGSSQNWVAVAAGQKHSLAIRSDGSLWAWGDNSDGQLGDGTLTTRTHPVPIMPGTTWVAVAAGWFHSLAIRSDGTLWAWGDNTYGQVGDGTTATHRSVPTQIGTWNTWVAIAADGGHSLGITSQGYLWGWGLNHSGQVGDGTTTNRNRPTRIMGLPGPWIWASVAAGGHHSMAIRTDGTLWVWGENTYGQVGDGTTTNRTVPTRVGTETDWVAIAGGGNHSLAIRQGGTLWAWGRNYYGQLGDGTTVDRYAPIRISTGTSSWVAIDAGFNHSLALRGGTLWSWGSNADGQLGIGTETDAQHPTQCLTNVKSPVPATPTTTTSSSTTTSSTTTSSTTTTTLAPGTVFSDVADDHPYHDAIYYLAGLGVITGFEDGTFRPNASVTRQQFAKMIVKTLGYTVTGSEVCPFTDVATQTGTDPFYPSKYVAVCASHGITQGKTATTFAPGDNITHQQLITMVTRAAGLSDPPVAYTPTFSAGQFFPNEHYLNARKAAYAGLLDGLQGVGPTYDFLAASTRGECAQLLYDLSQR